MPFEESMIKGIDFENEDDSKVVSKILKLPKKYRIIILLLIIGISSNTVTYALSGKNIYEVFFSKNEYKANSLMDYNNQKILIDDYTILLKQTLWDKQTGIGYLIFEITKKDSKPEIKLNRYGQCIGLGFGESDRFGIEDTPSGNTKYEYIGDNL